MLEAAAQALNDNYLAKKMGTNRKSFVSVAHIQKRMIPLYGRIIVVFGRSAVANALDGKSLSVNDIGSSR